MSEDNYNFWFHSAKPIKFFVVDYRVTIFVIFFFLHMRFWTFSLLIVFFVFFYILELKNLDMINALKLLRSKLAGNKRLIKRK